ncbi:MAG: hypothetical protein CVV57_09430 [Tenericutes bacterium HGW-Tenericutes-2]|nr:MAG: hypothetical protein CVV57_09430 [Tenericutes bacterium HGW-Tenericutes-2]
MFVNLGFSSEILYFLSRVVALLHLLYVLFVFLGLFYIYIGFMFKIKLIRNVYFRVIHLIAMIVVAIQQYFLVNCPLTVLEKKLLTMAGKPTYSGAFVANMMNKYSINIPTDYYLYLYVSLSLLFIASFILIPPKIKRKCL